ncbi:MAG: acetylglucosamine-6-sulfatase [Verrucomicrobiales bacterium]|nr:acetylglucosamine-6-sulfatase [Verrucomicrobiales bacterium]|tara:strand:- start:27951 stop:29411 length:1461 start_codon:yes stop_codon:yes gene_type:complete
MKKTLVFTVAFAPLLLIHSWADDRMNMVFLLTDDQTTYSMGCYGNEDVQTPHMDSLARDGIAFDRHYDTTAICMASRATIFTGLFEYRNGCNFDHGHLMREHWDKSYPILLREAGYRTAIAGKIGIELSDKSEDNKKGYLPEDDFDVWGAGPGQTSYDTKKNKSMAKYAEEYPHASVSYGAFGRDFIKEMAEGDAPFCLSISFKAPHMPATPDPQFDHVYEGKTFRKPANYGRENGGHFSKQSREGRQYERFESWGYKDRYDEVMATYHQQIYGVDVAIGMIREALEEAGIANHTVIIFTSDNGFLCGSHGYGSKVVPYEESSRVPMLMYIPGHENSGKQLRSSALTGNTDFFPTMLELAGVEVPDGIDGKSLLPLYDNPESETHTQLPLINVWGPKAVQSLGVVTKEWKYIYWPYDESDGFNKTEEMYHLAKDPHELTDLVANPEHEVMLKELRQKYDSEVIDWKDKAVPFNNYQPYGEWFERAE